MKRRDCTGVLFLLLMLMMSGCAFQSQQGITQSQTAQSTSSEAPVTKAPVVNESSEPTAVLDPAEEMLQKLTRQEKVGQLAIIGMEGTEINSDMITMIHTYKVGGVIFFKDNMENTEQAVSLFNALKKENAVNPLPLWLSIDEEGGRVTRFPDEMERLPSGGTVGATGDSSLALEFGEQIGSRLTAFGLNMVFGPVLDVNSNPNNPVIGDRSFSSSAEQAGDMGTAVMKGIRSSQVVSVVKHFPGHGDTSVDSHTGLPVVKHRMERLNAVELLPFRQAVSEGADAVMIAHLLMESIDPETPASYSEPVITGLLREELGFEGLIITDDMTMGAIASGKIDIGEAAVRSILAGTNIVLVGHDIEKELAVIKALNEAAASGRISEKVLNERVLTVLRMKQKYKLADEQTETPDVEKLNGDAEKLISKLK